MLWTNKVLGQYVSCILTLKKVQRRFPTSDLKSFFIILVFPYIGILRCLVQLINVYASLFTHVCICVCVYVCVFTYLYHHSPQKPSLFPTESEWNNKFLQILKRNIKLQHQPYGVYRRILYNIFIYRARKGVLYE